MTKYSVKAYIQVDGWEKQVCSNECVFLRYDNYDVAYSCSLFDD